MGISLNNFVDITLDYEKTIESVGTRDIVVFLDDTASNNEYDASEHTDGYFEDKELTELPTDSTKYKVEALKWFFNLGGKKVHYIKYYKGSSDDTDYEVTISKIKSLPCEEIAIAGSFSEEKMFNVAKKCKDLLVDNKSVFKGINEKMFFSCTNSTEIDEERKELDNYVLKYTDDLDNYKGIELSILAYLSNINIDRGLIEDYCYTKEDVSKVNENFNPLDDNETFKTLKKNNINVIIKFINDTVNYGGNMTYVGANNKTIDLVNNYVKIMLTQTLTESLTSLLQKKIRYSQNSVNLISAYITSELNRYKDFGYLTTDKTYEGQDEYDGNYLLIKHGTKLNLGYKICILPISSLDSTQKANHELPKIHLYLADSYSIRTITINGKIID